MHLIIINTEAWAGVYLYEASNPSTQEASQLGVEIVFVSADQSEDAMFSYMKVILSFWEKDQTFGRGERARGRGGAGEV